MEVNCTHLLAKGASGVIDLPADLTRHFMKQKKKLFWGCVLSLIALLLLLIGNKADAQNISISTNMGQWLCFGTANIEAGFPVERHFSLHAKGVYNPFTFGEEANSKYYKRVGVALGTRYWPWFVNSGWFMEGDLAWTKYSFGGIFTEKSYEGDAYGAVLGGGYALMLGKGFNLEMGLGAFAGVKSFTKYSCVKCGKVEGKGTKFALAPADVLLRVRFLF